MMADGYIELTNYGEWLYSLTGSDLLCEIAPWIDASALEVHEVDRLLWFHRRHSDTAPTPARAT